MIPSPVSWTKFGSSLYAFSSAPATWVASESACAALAPGSHLASIHSDAELGFVSQLNPAGAAQRWSGARLNRTSSPQTAPFTYTWTDDSTYGFSKFASGQPDDAESSEECLQIDNARPSQWSDVACSLLRPAVCKRPGLTVVVLCAGDDVH